MNARRTYVLVLVAILSSLPLSAKAVSPMDEARAFLSDEFGGRPADWNLVAEASVVIEGTAEAVWVGKFVDERRHLSRIAYSFSDGSFGDSGAFAKRAATAVAKLPALDRKADRALMDRLRWASEERIPVAVWLAVDTSAAVAAVVARHPEVGWTGDRFDATDLASGRALRAELDGARQEVYAAAQAAFKPLAEGAGGRVEYSSLFAPLVFVDLPQESVAAVAELSTVRSLGLDGDGWRPSLNFAGPTVQANWGVADQGTGVRVGVIEYYNVREVGDLAGQVVASHSTAANGLPVFQPAGTGLDHPTWVAGAIASLDAATKGVAPGADIVSSSTAGGGAGLARDQNVIRAADWALAAAGGDSDVLNVSLNMDSAAGRDQARAYFDSISGGESFRTVVAATGNFDTGFDEGWIIGAPGNAWNVLTVGGTNDGNSAAWGNDVLWFGANFGAQYEELVGAPYNSHNDFNKPNVSAPAAGVATANGLSASGTSVAAPITSGIAAQLLANTPALLAWPEAMRAIIMSSALHHTPMPNGGGINRDHEGAGTVSARWANIIDVEGGAGNGGFKKGSLAEGGALTQAFSAKQGDKVRVAFAWNSNTSGGMFTKTDSLDADLDLQVDKPDGTFMAASRSWDNAYEWVEFTAPVTGTYTIRITQARWDGSLEFYGLAWTKWLPGTE